MCWCMTEVREGTQDGRSFPSRPVMTSKEAGCAEREQKWNDGRERCESRPKTLA